MASHPPLQSLPLSDPRSTPLSSLPAATDITRWHLSTPGLDDPAVGRHLWTYDRGDNEAHVNDNGNGSASTSRQTLEDKFWLGLPTDQPKLPRATTPSEAAENGFAYYSRVAQSPDGHFAGEYGGPLFLLPGFVIGCYVTHTPFPDEWRIEVTRYLEGIQNEDGGWGLHIAGPSTVFGTSCNYVVLRLLGNSPDLPWMTKARNLLHTLGGAAAVPSWGKLWLALLGVYDYEGMNPVPPELWLLPDWVPIHPWRWWIHTRMVYIPMGWLWGKKYVYDDAERDPIVQSLKQELFTQSYSSIHWPSQRNNIAQVDIFAPHTKTLNALMSLMGVYTKVVPNLVRNAGLDRAYTLLCKEDENTGYQCLGPVNKMLNYVVRWAVEGPDSHAMEQHREKLKDFLWMSGEGLQMCGTNGSQLWDAAFIAQAVSSSSRLVRNPEIKPSVQAILRWLDETQIKENPQHYRSCYRFATKGAWPFSTKQQGYTVSDCTAEGLKAVIDLQSSKLGLQALIDTPRLRQSVDLLLTMQNPSGGFASYETINGPAILEWINPAEVFGDIMIEYDYPECTTSVVGALCKFRSEVDPTYRRAEIDGTVERAVRYILRAQRADGSWFGSWAVCFTYATMFALESLSLAGQTYTSSAPVRKACEFLLARQSRTDGGWGESFESCVKGEWVPLDGGRSNVVQTAWALIALLHAQYPDEEPIRRAVKLLMQRQKDDGSWEDDGPASEVSEANGVSKGSDLSVVSEGSAGSKSQPQAKTKKDCLGVFNRNCGIVYPNYRFSFTIWALARAAQRLEGKE